MPIDDATLFCCATPPGFTGATPLTWSTIKGEAVPPWANITGKPTFGTAALVDTTTLATAAQGTKADSAVQPAGLTKAAVGLGNCDNTSDANKPVSSATQTALNAKEATANKNQASGYAGLDGSSKLAIAQVPTGQTASTVPFGNDARFTDARTPTAHASSHASDGSDPVVSATAATSATTGTMTVTMPSTSDQVITITPTGACTFNGTGGKAGARATFYITTSGASSFTLTWGTNYKTTGTLATGTSSGKVFTVSFVCKDGTTWAETGRTAAM